MALVNEANVRLTSAHADVEQFVDYLTFLEHLLETRDQLDDSFDELQQMCRRARTEQTRAIEPVGAHTHART
jgi:hypothetical protein